MHHTMILYLFFWIAFSLLFFCYIGYGLLVFIINLLKKPFIRHTNYPGPEENPTVSMIIAAYNEGIILKEKIINTLAIDYPRNKLKIIFVTDGTTDGSEKLVAVYPEIILMHQPERQGKLAAITRAMTQVKTPYVVFSDANTMLNSECIRKIMFHYADPSTGGVAGEKKIINTASGSAIGDAEGLYWQYESFMKKQDAGLNTVVGAAGELFSIRTHLFDPPSQSLVLDDFVISMKVCLKGYKIKYEPHAYAAELPSASLEEEKKRKIRISAGAFQAIYYLRQCLNVFKYPLLFFQYFSRRLLRWLVCPWAMILLLVINILIVNQPMSPVFYAWFLGMQLLFYMAAVAGWLLIRYGRHIGLLSVPFYFLFMNYCLVKGLVRFLKKQQPVEWERSQREEI